MTVGSMTAKVEPSPRVLSTLNAPPCASTMVFAIRSPGDTGTPMAFLHQPGSDSVTTSSFVARCAACTRRRREYRNSRRPAWLVAQDHVRRTMD
jgi:hypothetical protein